VVEAGVGNNDQPWFLEGTSDVVGEVTGRETASDGLGAGVGSEFENGTVSISS